MSDEMPDIIYASSNEYSPEIRGYSAGLEELEGDTKYISQASSNQAVRDALDEVREALVKSTPKYPIPIIDDFINNLKSKYEGE